MKTHIIIPIVVATAAAGVGAAILVGNDPLSASTTTVQPVQTNTAIVSVKGKATTVKVKVHGKKRTITLPGTVRTVNGQTVFVPGQTVTLPPITKPGKTTTLTLPGTTVTLPGTTTTVTSPPTTVTVTSPPVTVVSTVTETVTVTT